MSFIIVSQNDFVTAEKLMKKYDIDLTENQKKVAKIFHLYG